MVIKKKRKQPNSAKRKNPFILFFGALGELMSDPGFKKVAGVVILIVGSWLGSSIKSDVQETKEEVKETRDNQDSAKVEVEKAVVKLDSTATTTASMRVERRKNDSLMRLEVQRHGHDLDTIKSMLKQLTQKLN